MTTRHSPPAGGPQEMEAGDPAGRAVNTTPGPERDGPITDEVRELVQAQRLCYVATASPEGQPNLSPKGSLKVLDPHHLGFAHMASPQTIANLRTNPRLEINVVDPFLRRGYRIKGTAEVTDDQELLGVVGGGLGHDYPVHAAVYITVTDVSPVDSPVYLFTDTPADEVQAMWQDIYGYQPTPSKPGRSLSMPPSTSPRS